MQHSVILLFSYIEILVFAKTLLGLYIPNSYGVKIYKTADEFEQDVLNSNKITIIQFFSSSLCDLCKDFQADWAHFAEDTKLWQKKMLNIAAMDCSLASAEKICDNNKITSYPEFRLYHAWQTRSIGVKKGNLNIKSRSEQFMKTVIDFCETQRHWPPEWPTLSFYK